MDKQKTNIKKTAAILAVSLIVISFEVYITTIHLDYKKAETLEQSGDYKAAADIYENHKYYRDSDERFTQCSINYAHQLIDEHKFESAEEILREVDDGETLVYCKYKEAEHCLNTEQYEKAFDIFTELEDYENSMELAEKSLDGIYMQAQKELAKLNYDEAERLFECCGDYKACDKFQAYMDFRKEQVPSDKDIIKSSHHMVKLEKGSIYYVRDFYYYIPDVIDENTKCSMYFAGGTGGVILTYETVRSYFRNFEPNAIMVFYMGSGINNIDYKIQESFEILNYFTVKNNITIHDLIITGSSLGCATALKAAVKYYDSYNICPVAVGALDNACDWDIPYNLNDEELKLLAQSGTIVCLYEQSTEICDRPVEEIRDSGSKLVMIGCKNKGHDAISRYGFSRGCFDSLWTGEFDSEEYKTQSFNITGNAWS